MTVPLPERPRVAIIGGGLSGLVCAQECLALGLDAHVFDTGVQNPPARPCTAKSAASWLACAGLKLDIPFMAS